MTSPLRRASIAALALTLALAPAPTLAADPEGEGPEGADAADATTPAAAAQGPVETIEYTDGHRIKGQFIEVVPDDSITLVSAATGRTVRVPWSQIARYTRDGAWVGDTEPRRERPTSSGYGPRVHIDAPSDVALYQIVGEGTAVGADVVIAWMHYRPVCRAPCNDTVDVSTGAKFFVGGDKYTGSRRLNLGDKRGNLTLQVKLSPKPTIVAAWPTFSIASASQPTSGGVIGTSVIGSGSRQNAKSVPKPNCPTGWIAHASGTTSRRSSLSIASVKRIHGTSAPQWAA